MNDFASRISYREALEILGHVVAQRRMPVERLATARADGRVLAEDVAAPVALPGFDNSAMDGFALRASDLAGAQSLRLVGEQFAGQPPGAALGPGECVRITTGAVLPPGADAILIKEQAREHDGLVTAQVAVSSGQHVRRAGEDVAAGEQILAAGSVLTPARIGLAASTGIAQLPVSARPTVAVLTTGDELVEPGMSLAAGQVYNSNRDQLMAQLRALGLAPTAWPTLPDDPARILSLLRDAGDAFDLVMTCGGVSAGERDFLPGLLQQHGRVHFWRVRLRPGMPVLFAEIGRALVLCLPGNPVSVLATFVEFAQPLIDGLEGRQEPRPRWRAALRAPWDKRHARMELLRGRLQCGDDGRLSVHPHPADGSHRLRGAADSDVLLLLPEGERRFEAGELVEVIPY